MKIQAYSLSEAYIIASKELNCLAADINIEVIKKPSSGIFGLFKKIGEFEAILASQKAKGARKQDLANKKNTQEIATKIDSKLLAQIKSDLELLFKTSSFEIFVSEVSLYNDKVVFIKLDGKDSALLIGKEGYRYNALLYLLYNWLNSKYGIAVRLEIAEFLKNQEAAMSIYLQSVIKKVQEQGHASTKKLDGILLNIALEQLRQKFPQKYVGVKNNDDNRYIIINDFYKK